MRKKNDEMKAFLGRETEFDGKMLLSGSVRIDGVFKGEIWGAGTLVVGKDASVEAAIAVDRIQISGAVKGTLEIKDRVEITETGSFIGTVQTTRFVIAEGGVFDGQCFMDNRGDGSGEKRVAPDVLREKTAEMS